MENMGEKFKLNSEMILKIWKKSKLNSENIWKKQKKCKLNSENMEDFDVSHNYTQRHYSTYFFPYFPNLFTIQLTIPPYLQYLSLFNLSFFHIFPIFSLFNLLFLHIFQIFSLFNIFFSSRKVTRFGKYRRKEG
jgi:hypothetical protein